MSLHLLLGAENGLLGSGGHGNISRKLVGWQLGSLVGGQLRSLVGWQLRSLVGWQLGPLPEAGPVLVHEELAEATKLLGSGQALSLIKQFKVMGWSRI
jgi:hypothetical protein